MGTYIAAIDQGTTSTRCIVFNDEGAEVSRHQREHHQILPQPGWVEHDPVEIIARVHETLAGALGAARLTGRDITAIGITNQRETIVVWNPKTGRPWCNAIVWQDTRTAEIAARLEPRAAWLRERTGLPPSTYFSAAKVQWILDHVDGVRDAVRHGEAVCGTMDAWLIWNLTGGASGGLHVTDVTNASRTQLMNLATLAWDDELLALFQIPREMLPSIAASSDPRAFGTTRGDGPPGAQVPITGVLGDQQAAMLGQMCTGIGDAKNTYGTGNFLLMNTGAHAVQSANGLLTTVCYQAAPGIGPAKAGRHDRSGNPHSWGPALAGPPIPHGRAQFALEGSVAVTGSAVQWLRDQLGVISTAAEVEPLARSVPDNGGVYFVPAFSGLFAPYWRADARGVIVGLTRHSTKAHLARATLEAICFQTRAVLDAMTKDARGRLDALKVDGGATANDTLMQLQADILGVPVVRPVVQETTALGAAYAAGLATGVWKNVEALRAHWKEDRRWDPRWSADQRETAYAGWQRAVERSLDWVRPT